MGQQNNPGQHIQYHSFVLSVLLVAQSVPFAIPPLNFTAPKYVTRVVGCSVRQGATYETKQLLGGAGREENCLATDDERATSGPCDRGLNERGHGGRIDGEGAAPLFSVCV